VKSDLF